MNNIEILICYKFTNKYGIIQDYCDIKCGNIISYLNSIKQTMKIAENLCSKAFNSHVKGIINESSIYLKKR